MQHISWLVVPALLFTTPALAQQARSLDGWTFTEDATSCTASLGNSGERITGWAGVSSRPESSDWAGRFAITLDIATIRSLSNYAANNIPMEVQARLPSGRIVPLPSTSSVETGRLMITPRGLDRAYIAALTGQVPIDIEVRVDQTAIRTPDPNTPYQRAFSLNMPPVDNLLAAIDACNARIRANRVPVVREGLSDRVANSVCPYNVTTYHYDPVAVPPGVYRLKIGTDGRIAETEAPASHAIPADRTNPLYHALREIPPHIRRLRFIPAFNASLEPVEAWIDFSWPAINCPADVRN
jgi:hypothetical protein